MSDPAIDAAQFAAQIGRLDLLTSVLGALAIIIVFGGIAAFLNIRSGAKRTAKKVAKKVAEEITEKAVNTYIQENIHDIIHAYEDLFKNTVDASVADEIAAAQEKLENEHH